MQPVPRPSARPVAALFAGPVAHAPGGLVRRARLADEEHPWLRDTLVAVVVLLLGFGTVHAGAPSDIFGHRVISVPTAVVVATAVAQTLPLAWRRLAPLTVFWIVLAVCLLQVSLRLALRTDVSLMIALYSVARYAAIRRRVAVLLTGAGTVTIIVLVIFRVPHLHSSTPFAVFFLCCAAAAATALGLARRARQAELVAVSDRAARLEIERDQRAKIATAAERARVSREMHDIVGHNLAVIIGLADGGAALAPSSPERAAEAMRLIATTGRQALSELRLTLAPANAGGTSDGAVPDLRPQPGTADVPGLLDRIRAAGPRVTYTTSGDLGTLTPGLQLAVYRIAQEALTNALRHAGTGTVVQVTLDANAGPDANGGGPGLGDGDGQVLITVEDTGPRVEGPVSQAMTGGGHDGQAHAGRGLAGIRERARLLGGTAQAGPRPGGGWAVHASLPARRQQ